MKRWIPIRYPGPGDSHRNFNESTGDRGSWPDAVGYQQMLDELTNLGTAAGLTPSDIDSQQVLKAVRSQKLNFVVATAVTGTANAISLAFSPAFTTLADLVGAPLVFLAEGANSAAVTITVDGLAAVAVTWPDGTALASGDIASGVLLIIRYDGTAYRMQQCLSPARIRSAAFRLAAPYLGFHGDPMSQSFASGTAARVANYTGIINNLPGASHTAGTITIGTTGFYQVTANMTALLPDVGANYGSTIAVSKVDGSNVVIASVAAASMECLTTSFSGSRANSASGIVKLTAGERIAAFFGQNSGVARNMSISFDVEFRGA